ncbi:MAG: hypothetical protein IJ113_00895 [Eggerthellaceae bacterium]|nr:hypothetical protein [Eggerthellaceae bacterium]
MAKQTLGDSPVVGGSSTSGLNASSSASSRRLNLRQILSLVANLCIVLLTAVAWYMTLTGWHNESATTSENVL